RWCVSHGPLIAASTPAVRSPAPSPPRSLPPVEHRVQQVFTPCRTSTSCRPPRPTRPPPGKQARPSGVSAGFRRCPGRTLPGAAPRPRRPRGGGEPPAPSIPCTGWLAPPQPKADAGKTRKADPLLGERRSARWVVASGGRRAPAAQGHEAEREPGTQQDHRGRLRRHGIGYHGRKTGTAGLLVVEGE